MNNNPDSPPFPNENSFEGSRPPPPTNNVAETSIPPSTNAAPTTSPSTNVAPVLPPPPANVPANNETREKPKKKIRKKEFIVGGDPIMTTLRLGADSHMVSGVISSKSKSGKKPEANAPKIARPCTECGKQFWSLKALFGHMRCHPERQWRGINPPVINPVANPPVNPPTNPQKDGSSPTNPQGLGLGEGVDVTDDDQDVATGLLMLANGLLSMDATHFLNDHQGSSEPVDSIVGEPSSAGYECSSCKRVFGTHQALGGHRASHKNVKGCFAISAGHDDDGNNANEEDNNSNNEAQVGKSKGSEDMILSHRCGVCNRVFSSGQALGGHMRCHWEKGENSSSSSVQQRREKCNPVTGGSSNTRGGRDAGGFVLDLNMPPPQASEPAPTPAPVFYVDDDSSSTSSSEIDLNLKLGF